MTECASSLCERFHQWLDEIFTFYNMRFWTEGGKAVEPIFWQQKRWRAKLPPARKSSDDDGTGVGGGVGGVGGVGGGGGGSGIRRGATAMAAGVTTEEDALDREYIVIPIGEDERLIEKKYLDGYSNGAGKRRHCGDVV